jgi:hypothetical protein
MQDWLLFGHDFAGRRAKGQEIMLFTFHFLLSVVSPDYSVHSHIGRAKGACDNQAASNATERECKLRDVHRIFTQAYAQCFTNTSSSSA